MSAPDLIHIDTIRAATTRLAGRVRRTPVTSATSLGRLAGCRLSLKLELFQRTGAFKIRGALNRLGALSAAERARGVCTVSAGNHAQCVALAARLLDNTPCTVVMPEQAVRSKVEATRAYGAEVILHGDLTTVFARVKQVADERNQVFIHPFDHPDIIAGQGTVGLETMEDLQDVDVVVVPIGGGGLASGVATAVKSMAPHCRVIGVEPFGADSMHRSLASGKPEKLEAIDTIADGLSAPFAGELTLAHCQAHLDDLVRVTDDELVTAMRLLLERCKVLAEPAGAAATAALLAGRIAGLGDHVHVAAIVSGGNIDLDQVARLVAKT